MIKVHALTAHFGDFSWTEHLLKKLFRSAECKKFQISVTVINQDRKEESFNRIKLLGNVDVVQFEPNQSFIQKTGHDHAWVLDRIWETINGDLIILFDCDAHPISDGWLDWVNDLVLLNGAVLAEDHLRPGKTHPCFMAMSSDAAKSGLCFSAQVLEDGEDTGRLISTQLCKKGFSPLLLKPRRVFCKIAGIIYDNYIYHHGSGTFHASKDLRLLDQVHKHDSIIKKIVLEDGLYDFSPLQKYSYMLERFFEKISMKIGLRGHQCK